MNLTDTEKQAISEYNAEHEALELRKKWLIDKYADIFNGILDSGDAKLIEEFERRIFPGYYEFEASRRLRTLKKVKEV